jgi:hypothetical protein
MGLQDAASVRVLWRRQCKLERVLEDEHEIEPVKAQALRELEEITEHLRQSPWLSRHGAERCARAKRFAKSVAVTGSFTPASAALTALICSASGLGQASFPACRLPGLASGSTATASAVCCGWAPPGFRESGRGHRTTPAASSFARLAFSATSHSSISASKGTSLFRIAPACGLPLPAPC